MLQYSLTEQYNFKFSHSNLLYLKTQNTIQPISAHVSNFLTAVYRFQAASLITWFHQTDVNKCELS